MKILLQDNTPAKMRGEIALMLEMSAAHDPDFNGVEFEVELGDYTCVVDDDTKLGQKTLYAIQNLIAGDREPGYTIDGAIYDRQ